VTINIRKSNKHSPVLQQMLSTLPSSRNALSILAEHAAANSLELSSRNCCSSHT